MVMLVALLTFVALAVDLGMLAVARTQCQDAADAAATAGTRTLNGTAGNNYSNASPSAIAAATANSVLSKPVASNQVALQIGRYTYVSANQRFEGQFPGTTGNWSMVKATVNADVSNNMAFSKVFNFAGTNIQATATAVHRPRDISIILDFSGSMRFASLMGDPYTGNRTSNNPDGVFPAFGHYSDQSTAALQATSFTSPYDPANISSTTSDGRAPIVNDFYSDSGGTRSVHRGLVGLCRGARRRQLSEDESKHRFGLLRHGAGPGQLEQLQLDLGRHRRLERLRPLRHIQRLHARPWLLGQDVLPVAARSESGQGLAASVLQHFRRRHQG